MKELLCSLLSKIGQLFHTRQSLSPEQREAAVLALREELLRGALELLEQEAKSAVQTEARCQALKAYIAWQRQCYKARQRCLIEQHRDLTPTEMQPIHSTHLAQDAVRVYLATQYEEQVERFVPREEVVVIFQQEFMHQFHRKEHGQ